MLGFNASDKEIIYDNQKWFKFFVFLPQLTTILYAVACFILGIAFISDTEGVSILIFWFGGAVFCLLNYAILKIVLSYQILSIYLLKQIASNKQSNNVASVNVFNKPDNLPEI